METFLKHPQQNPTGQAAWLEGRTSNEALSQHLKLKNLCTLEIWLRQAPSTLGVTHLLFTYSFCHSPLSAPSSLSNALLGKVKPGTMAYIQADRAIRRKMISGKS